MKVKELVKLLNKEVAAKGKPPKVIIFVKDRIIAFYLKRILEQQSTMRREQPEFFNNGDLLDPRYHVEMAMGPKGKNLVNRAYKSTKPSGMEQHNQNMLDSNLDSMIIPDQDDN